MSRAPYKTLTQSVVETLRSRILKGEFKAGAPLRQDTLAQELNVSRVPVREALMQLEAQGLVKFEAHRGAVVTELDAEAIDELFYLRAMLESDLLFQAFDQLTEEHLSQAEAILAEFDQMLETGDQIDRWSELNRRFHTTLYGPARRPRTLALVDQINLSCDRYIQVELLHSRQGIITAEREHTQLLALCRQRRKFEAAALLRQHIESAGRSIKHLLNSR
ncbi:GntR family transcriptional regulator [Oceanimonas sp. GK1]|uniref:GntR family transcriptional regulator n=1 Tax=Oceanimonas sp. (strain GK1 / IBRC-M 10197) TaxID=511062 RepID=UPI0002494A7E|nr:GntR family transcriptional regulator [Oceanimonas sp. GK1]AEY00307.1 GntR family transcriptional regulator [Oceanimonas sp. GK1]